MSHEKENIAGFILVFIFLCYFMRLDDFRRLRTRRILFDGNDFGRHIHRGDVFVEIYRGSLFFEILKNFNNELAPLKSIVHYKMKGGNIYGNSRVGKRQARSQKVQIV